MKSAISEFKRKGKMLNSFICALFAVKTCKQYLTKLKMLKKRGILVLESKMQKVIK